MSNNEMLKLGGIRQVAARAGVSTATVSRAINTPDLVKPKTLKLIRDAMEELKFFPDPKARALSSGATMTIGTVVPTLSHSTYSVGITSLQRVARNYGYALLVADSEHDIKLEKELFHTLIRQGVDGLVLRGVAYSGELEGLIQSRGIQCVTVGTFNPDGVLPTVGIDNREAGRIAVQHLIDLGHKNIAIVSASSGENERDQSRVDGMRDAIKAAELYLPDEHVQKAGYSLDDARIIARYLLKEPNNRPTAICCTNDLIANMIMFEASRMGFSVPDALSVIGIGDLELSRHVHPALTSVKIPTTEIWEKAGNLLFDLLDGKKPIIHIEFPIELAVRASTKTIRTVD